MDISLPALVGVVTGLVTGAPADIDSTPRALLEAIYHPTPAISASLTPNEVYSDRLQLLFATYFDQQQAGLVATSSAAPPVNLVPFDPLSLISAKGDVVISEPIVTGQHAVATVGIDNAQSPVQLALYMVEQPQGWRIDDVASFGGDGQQWLLSWILKYDPMDGN